MKHRQKRQWQTTTNTKRTYIQFRIHIATANMMMIQSVQVCSMEYAVWYVMKCVNIFHCVLSTC